MVAHDKLRALTLRVLAHLPLIPAKAGIQCFFCLALDPRFRGDERMQTNSIKSRRSAAPQQPGDTQWLA